MFALRAATADDLPEVVPRMHAFNAVEGIVIENLEAVLRKLFAVPELGGIWLAEEAGRVIGYAVISYGFDLEFGGRDSYLTELWIDPVERGRGAATAVLGLLDRELRARDIRALHLQVRPDNPAVRLYERSGFTASPRTVMTRRLG